MRPVVLFDVMDTLVREPFWVEVPAFFGLSLEDLMAQKHPTAWIDFEEGRLEEPEYLARFFRDGRPIDGVALRRHLVASYRWLDGARALLEELAAAGQPMHALSNYPVWYRLIDEALGLSRWLPWTFVSCRTGVRKPDAQAFLGAAAALGRPAGQCLLVDDQPANREAAAALGFDVVAGGDVGRVRAELVRRGLLPA